MAMMFAWLCTFACVGLGQDTPAAPTPGDAPVRLAVIVVIATALLVPWLYMGIVVRELNVKVAKEAALAVQSSYQLATRDWATAQNDLTEAWPSISRRLGLLRNPPRLLYVGGCPREIPRYWDELERRAVRQLCQTPQAIEAQQIENVPGYGRVTHYALAIRDPSIEDKIDIPESRKDDFRQEIMNYIGALALDGKKFEYHTNARLLKALELKLFEDQRDTIKLKNVVSGIVDEETQAKIDVVKQRLIKYFGYNETSATDVLNYVASIFARGDIKKED